ncbi:cytochrome P450 [Taklimakanibacter deserti]|uniref:cytochrome P450 n=1 Tax=Taklimakanibacter deserti TaxID=2267839 RepID=UPI000E655DCC
MKIDRTSRSVSLDPRDPGFVNDPYPAYHELRKTVPVFKWEQYGYWCFARHEDVAALLRDRRFGRQILHVMSREELGWAETPPNLKPFYDFEQHSLLETEPPVHTRLRGLVNRAFLSRTVERLRPRIAQLAHELIDGFADKRETDLLESFATPIPIFIIAELLGVPTGEGSRLLQWSHDMVAMYQARRDTEIERKAVAATVAFSDFMRGLVRERRASPGDDLLSQLIATEMQGNSLSEDELITTAILLLNAGHEATVHAIGNGVKALIETGQAGARLGEGHFEELLRYDAPLHLFTRYALEDVNYGGLKLRKGETVGLLLGAANRDPERFAEPDIFDPERTPNPHVSFGAGIHFCVGAPLARLELNVALPILFERLPGLKLAGPPRYRDAYHFHGLESLNTIW